MICSVIKHFLKHLLTLSKLLAAKHMNKTWPLNVWNLPGRHWEWDLQLTGFDLLYLSFVNYLQFFNVLQRSTTFNAQRACQMQWELLWESKLWTQFCRRESKWIPDFLLRHLFNIPNLRWNYGYNKDKLPLENGSWMKAEMPCCILGGNMSNKSQNPRAGIYPLNITLLNINASKLCQWGSETPRCLVLTVIVMKN